MRAGCLAFDALQPELAVSGGLIVADAQALGEGVVHSVAAEQTARLCRAIELAPKYVAVALERLAALGLEPRLVS